MPELFPVAGIFHTDLVEGKLGFDEVVIAIQGTLRGVMRLTGAAQVDDALIDAIAAWTSACACCPNTSMRKGLLLLEHVLEQAGVGWCSVRHASVSVAQWSWVRPECACVAYGSHCGSGII